MRRRTQPEDIRNPEHYFNRMMALTTMRERIAANKRKAFETPYEDQEYRISIDSCFDEYEHETLICSEVGEFTWIEMIESPQLFSAINKLSFEDKLIMTLLAKDGYKPKDVAEMLGCTRGKIYHHMRKLRKLLKSFF
ncbi:MAG: ArsR family transcriptional regulator [Christensenellaceae bacterium]|jgi:sugar-specific transcriptional regulator TrmB